MTKGEWLEFFMQELEFNKKKAKEAKREACRTEEEETEILDEEIDHQLKKLKERKAVGMEYLQKEIL